MALIKKTIVQGEDDCIYEKYVHKHHFNPDTLTVKIKDGKRIARCWTGKNGVVNGEYDVTKNLTAETLADDMFKCFCFTGVVDSETDIVPDLFAWIYQTPIDAGLISGIRGGGFNPYDPFRTVVVVPTYYDAFKEIGCRPAPGCKSYTFTYDALCYNLYEYPDSVWLKMVLEGSVLCHYYCR